MNQVNHQSQPLIQQQQQQIPSYQQYQQQSQSQQQSQYSTWSNNNNQSQDNNNATMTTGSNSNSNSNANSSKKYRDPIWAILFVILQGVLIYYCVMGVKNWEDVRDMENKEDQEHDDDNNDDDLVNDMNSTSMILSAFSLIVMASVFSGLWVNIMMKYAEDIIKCILWTSIVFYFIACGGSILIGNLVGAFLFGIMGIVAFMYMRCIASRIAFAGANLKLACAAIKTFSHILYVAWLILFVSIVLQIMWLFASFGMEKSFLTTAENTNNNDDANANVDDDDDEQDHHISGGTVFFLIISLIWMMQVLSYTLHTTVSGVVATWWFIKDINHEKNHVVSDSLKRSLTTSFGSICFGSLIVAFVSTIRSMLESQQRNGNRNNPCLLCLLKCFEDMIKYFTKWAFCYVGIYGTGFLESGKRVMELFSARGFSVILNDQLISQVLLLGAIMVGCVTSCVGLIVSFLFMNGNATSQAILGTLGFLIGTFVTLISMNVIESAVMTIMVCFVEDSTALNITHPEFHLEIMSAWQRRFPSTVF